MLNRRCAAVAISLTLSISGCGTKGPDNLNTAEMVLPPNSQFWTPPEDRSACPRSAWVDDLHLQRKVEGFNDGREGDRFAEALGENNSRAIGSEDFDLRGYVEQIVNAAETRAYTELDFGDIGGPSPVFVSSLILISLSYTVSIFDQEKAWPAADRQTVIEWGNKIDWNQQVKKRYSTLDSIAAIAAARMSWGSATSQPGIFGRGLDDFHVVASNMDENGQYEPNMRDNNEDVQFMILAAEAATRNGIAAYDFSYGGLTLHDAVKWHVDKTLDIGETGGRYTRANGRSAHIAWAPIYLSRFPDGATATGLKELLTSADRTRQGLRGTTMGGSTECLWGRRR